MRDLYEQIRFNKQNIDLLMAQKANHQRQMLISGSFALAMLGVTIASIYISGSIVSGGILPIITAFVGITITLIRLYWVTSVDHVAILKNDIYQQQHDLTTRLNKLATKIDWLKTEVSYRSATHPCHLFSGYKTTFSTYLEGLFKKDAAKAEKIISYLEERPSEEHSDVNVFTDNSFLTLLSQQRRGLVHGGFGKSEGIRILKTLEKDKLKLPPVSPANSNQNPMVSSP